MIELAATTVPPPLDASSPWTHWQLDPLTVLPVVAAAVAYGAGVRRLGRAGRRWPPARAVAFAAGLGALAIALVSPVDAYADVSFSVHMAQHLLLTLVAPPLLALGAPLMLALRSASSEARRRFLLPVLHGRGASFLSRPLVGWALFVLVPFVVHLSPLFDAALRNSVVHALEHGLWLSAALIYWWPIVGSDPTPRPMTYPARLLSLFLVIPAQSFLALALYAAKAPIYPSYSGLPAPWGPNALDDQQAAAVMMWLAGNFAMVAALLLAASVWKREDDARQRRLEEREDRQATRPGDPSGAVKGSPSDSQSSIPPSRL
jgi:cytochrome c oxidase assembly factor CtaG